MLPRSGGILVSETGKVDYSETRKISSQRVEI